MMNMKSAFGDERINQVEKCVGIFAYGFQQDLQLDADHEL